MCSLTLLEHPPPLSGYPGVLARGGQLELKANRVCSMIPLASKDASVPVSCVLVALGVCKELVLAHHSVHPPRRPSVLLDSNFEVLGICRGNRCRLLVC